MTDKKEAATIPFDTARCALAAMICMEADDNGFTDDELLDSIHDGLTYLESPDMEVDFAVWDAIGSYRIIVELSEQESAKLTDLYNNGSEVMSQPRGEVK